MTFFASLPSLSSPTRASRPPHQQLSCRQQRLKHYLSKWLLTYTLKKATWYHCRLSARETRTGLDVRVSLYLVNLHQIHSPAWSVKCSVKALKRAIRLVDKFRGMRQVLTQVGKKMKVQSSKSLPAEVCKTRRQPGPSSNCSSSSMSR
jgi:hypothetical protein